MMNRRAFLGILALLAPPPPAEAQQAEKIARIAMLRSEHRPFDERMRENIAALRAGLQDEGYITASTIESTTTRRGGRGTSSRSRERSCGTRST